MTRRCLRSGPPVSRKVLLAVAASLLVSAVAASAEGRPYPLIQRLSPSDLVFKQHQDAVAQAYRAENGNGVFPDLFFCLWLSPGGEDLFSLAARLSLPYESLASLNGFANPAPIAANTLLLVPSVPGIFLPEQPRNDIDLILMGRLATEQAQGQRITVLGAPQPGNFSFYRSARLQNTERSFFLNIGFRSPLPKAVLSSMYGMRKSPIDGHDRFHQGIDLAAPMGTEVLAARAGRVTAIQEDPALGLMLVVEHEGGWRTVYGHLSKVFAELNQRVLSGTIIGAVGSTGLSTGPHLHFEIRMGTVHKDPSSLIPGKGP
jgi:murein DD-endopeptidase MepM/ murein hydrolase activator NlpD